jgi:tetratricopeptide (TPR) repeat protein
VLTNSTIKLPNTYSDIKENVLNPEIELQQIWQSLGNKKLTSAFEKSQQLCLTFPDFAPGWFAASIVACEQGRFDAALENVDHALRLSPSIDQWTLHKARIYFLKGQRTKANKLAQVLINSSQKNLSFCSELGLLFNKLGNFQSSLECYQSALEIQPNNPQTLFNLASVQRYMGQLEAAQNSFDQLIMLKPDDSEAWLLRSNLKKQTPEHNHLIGLQEVLKQPKTAISKAQLFYALGKELEDLHKFDEAFEALRQGAQTRRANMQYTLENDLAVLTKISQVYSHKMLNKAIVGCESPAPIFILGLPRTGSTLVERILANHSDVYAAGELNNFAIAMMHQVRQLSNTPPADKLALIAATSEIDFAQLGQNYIQSTRPDTNNHARFIDKLPLNSLYVGLIRLALPNAQLIYVARHPLATFFAIFKQCFTQGYPFSYDLDELCEYQIAHHKLMQHWQQQLGQHLYSLSYENLVTDIEGETRKLLDYCELPWEPNCFEFQQNKTATTTASASQVRQPLYSSSIGKWKKFSQQLSEVKLRFEAAGITCD